MPVIVTFDIEGPKSNELNRIRGMFERLGWEHLGNTAYRYPKLDGQHDTEDWFNHVIPALMLLRTFGRSLERSNRKLVKFSIDVQSSTGYNPHTGAGKLPLASSAVTYYDTSDAGKAFGLSNLKDWLESTQWPY